MRRLLLLPALALLAAPASAQTDDAPRTVERSVTIERDGDGPHVRRMIVVDGDTTVFEGPAGRFELAPGGEAVLEFEGGGPARFFRGDGERAFRLRGPGGRVRFGDGGPGEAVRLQLGDGPELAFFGDEAGPLHGMVARLMGHDDGAVSAETRDRMRTLEREARELARAARDGDAAAERELDAVLGDLFEVRAEARREQAAHLREQADEIEAALDERAANREALIRARRAELLGTGADW